MLQKISNYPETFKYVDFARIKLLSLIYMNLIGCKCFTNASEEKKRADKYNPTPKAKAALELFEF